MLSKISEYIKDAAGYSVYIWKTSFKVPTAVALIYLETHRVVTYTRITYTEYERIEF
jgi:hypothetical protein